MSDHCHMCGKALSGARWISDVGEYCSSDCMVLDYMNHTYSAGQDVGGWTPVFPKDHATKPVEPKRQLTEREQQIASNIERAVRNITRDGLVNAYQHGSSGFQP